MLSKMLLNGNFSDAVMKIVSDYAPKKASQREPGEGEKRAQARLAAKRKANKAIPSAYRQTRQQRRRHMIDQMKGMRISPAEFGRRKMDAINKGRVA